MTHPAEEVISQFLDSGERLLWAARPRGGIRLRGQDVFLIPFSLFWGGFAIFWEYTALNGASRGPGPGAVFPLFGVPFVLVGLYLIAGRFFVDAWMRENTCYGVTAERIIIVSGLFSVQSRDIPMRSVTETTLSLRGDGSGTITFGSAALLGLGNGFVRCNTNSSWPGGNRVALPAFEFIEDAKGVNDIIRKAQKAA